MPQEKKRVFVTGMGIISAVGADIAQTRAALLEGKCGISRISSVDTSSFRFHDGAEVRYFRPEEHFSCAQIDLLDRFAQLALVAAREAITDLGISEKSSLEEAAIVTGSSIGGQSSQDAEFASVYGRNSRRVHPLTIPRTMPSAAVSHISMEFGVVGPAYNVSTACASATHAIGQAFWMVREGQVGMAIAGGSESPFSYGFLKAWEAMRVISPEACRPFCKNRQGLILGEGAAFLVLEPYEAVCRRGSKTYGEILGFGMSSDAAHITSPTIDGPAKAMKLALRDARINASDIGYINAHGTGTILNDLVEAKAIHAVFGSHTKDIAVSSTKAMHGHALGASGAIEAVLTLLALSEGLIPPTVNFTVQDPECDLNVVQNSCRKALINVALSNSFAFGGLNAVLVFGRAKMQ